MNDSPPDWEAVRSLAAAYFGQHYDDLLAEPVEVLARLMRLANIDAERLPGLLAAPRSLDATQVQRQLLH